MKEILSSAAARLDVALDETALARFEKYRELLCEWNLKMNLTAITDDRGIAVKHFADSLSLLSHLDFPKGAKIIDVGTGAGFPGLALKIARPDLDLTLLDSLNKRLSFLAEVLAQTRLTARLVHLRAEEGGNDRIFRENFDFAVARAVAKLNVLSEFCLPYVKVGGCFVAMKGPNADSELAQAKKSAEVLGGKLEKTCKFCLPLDGGERTVLIIKKIAHTPKGFPRSFAKIKTRPL